MKIISKSKMIPTEEEDLRHEGDLKNEDNPKIEQGTKIKHELKNEDDRRKSDWNLNLLGALFLRYQKAGR